VLLTGLICSKYSGSSGSGEKLMFKTLERFPREAHGKHNILKWWGGVRESMP
jgi:hypothetical protein